MVNSCSLGLCLAGSAGHSTFTSSFNQICLLYRLLKPVTPACAVNCRCVAWPTSCPARYLGGFCSSPTESRWCLPTHLSYLESFAQPTFAKAPKSSLTSLLFVICFTFQMRPDLYFLAPVKYLFSNPNFQFTGQVPKNCLTAGLVSFVLLSEVSRMLGMLSVHGLLQCVSGKGKFDGNLVLCL